MNLDWSFSHHLLSLLGPLPLLLQSYPLCLSARACLKVPFDPTTLLPPCGRNCYAPICSAVECPCLACLGCGLVTGLASLGSSRLSYLGSGVPRLFGLGSPLSRLASTVLVAVFVFLGLGLLFSSPSSSYSLVWRLLASLGHQLSSCPDSGVSMWGDMST